jgi:hypothetical protein
MAENCGEDTTSVLSFVKNYQRKNTAKKSRILLREP